VEQGRATQPAATDADPSSVLTPTHASSRPRYGAIDQAQVAQSDARNTEDGVSVPTVPARASLSPVISPLRGLRVVDFSRVLAGPYCTMLLADLGADVVKVERPGVGDETRTWGPPFVGDQSAYYLAVNRGKRSCAIDFSSAEGRTLARDLCIGADVVVENFRSGAADRLGLGYSELRGRNPGLVYCSITGFGSTRTPSDRAGYDFVVQAESGLMSITGDPDGPPTKVGVALVDVLAGLNAAVGILAAIQRRHDTGVGARVEASLLDSALSALVNQAQTALVTGHAPERLGNAHPTVVPYETFQARDAMIAVAAANDGLFQRLCRVLDCPELAVDSRYATNSARVANRESLIPVLAAKFVLQDADVLLEALAGAGVPSGKIRDVHDALGAARDAGESATLTVEHSTLGPLDLVRTAIRIDDTSTASTLPPPRLGEHTREILRGLGREDPEIDELVKSRAIQL
jgi:crotonobetainyl-CoA:carnitine CoA-transferase CaiB-like acyl-CoA transferase